MSKPDIFIVGVAKAGTTTLHDLLDEHPDVFMSTPKEPHHLADVTTSRVSAHPVNAIRSETRYLRLFNDAKSRRAGESSTTYWWRPETAERIDSFSPGSQVVILLRDPCQRAFSHYLNDVRDGHEHRPFGQTLVEERPGASALEWGNPNLRIELGFYADRLRSYQETFGERLLVVLFEEFAAEQPNVYREVLDFLRLAAPEQDIGATAEARRNSHRVPRGRMARRILDNGPSRRVARRLIPDGVRAWTYESLMRSSPKPAIPDESMQRLQALYAADSAAVEDLLGRSMPWSTSPSFDRR